MAQGIASIEYDPSGRAAKTRKTTHSKNISASTLVWSRFSLQDNMYVDRDGFNSIKESTVRFHVILTSPRGKTITLITYARTGKLDCFRY